MYLCLFFRRQNNKNFCSYVIIVFLKKILLSSFKINSLTNKKSDDYYHDAYPFHQGNGFAINHPHR